MTSEQKTTTAKAKTKAAKEAELAAKDAQLHAKEKAAAVEAETAQEESKTKVSDAVAPETPNVQPEANQAQSEGEDISQKLPKAENVNDESSTPGNVVQDDSASVKEAELEAKEAALKAQEDAYDAAMTLRSQNLSLHVKDRDELNQESQPVKDNLLPLQLKVINHGEACLCFVTKNVIPANGEVVITYPSNKKRDIAIKNFAQINALSGFMRLEVEG